MAAVVTAITSAINATSLWGVVGDAVPVITIAVLFALGYRILKKATTGTSQGKVRM